MKKNFTFCITALLMVIQLNSIRAQELIEPIVTGNSAQEVLDKLSNPAAAIGAMINMLDFQIYNGTLTDSPNSAQTAFHYGFQPSLPVPLNNGVNMFIRPLIPINFSQPVINSPGFENAGFDLGDISADVAFGKTFNKKWLLVGGVFGSFPTATDERIGLHQILLGPEAAYGRVGKWGSVTLLLTYGWSVTNNDERGKLQTLGGQYMYNFNLGNAWSISGNPTFSFTPKLSAGNKWSFPIGGGIKKVLKAGKTMMALGIQYYYYVAKPEAFGLAHQIRLQITPIVPLPW